jgi:hypothetical protein
MTQYRLQVLNASNNFGTCCLYQTNPANDPAFSLAWMTEPAGPESQVNFQWQPDYSFSWGQTGSLMPGVDFQAAQMQTADPSAQNLVTLTSQNGSYSFTNETSGPAPGTLSINCDASVQPNSVSVGVAMSNATAFATQGVPNTINVFRMQPQFRLAFGQYQTGQVLDANSIPNSVQIEFPPNVFSMVATLSADGNWTVNPN